MQHPRSGEDKSIPFRNQRFFCSNGVWYFKARGGKQIGPFADKQEMQVELDQFINEQRRLNMSHRQPG